MILIDDSILVILPGPGVALIRPFGDSRATGRMIAEIVRAAMASGDDQKTQGKLGCGP
jgi:hypothetical protein